MLKENKCAKCIHFEVCAYGDPDVKDCDSFVTKSNKVKRFIILSNDDLDKIKNGNIVILKHSDLPYDILCASTQWCKEYFSKDNLPF